MTAQLDMWATPPPARAAEPLQPTSAELKTELDLLWRHVARYSGGKTYRAAVSKDLRGALVWQFSQWTLPEHQLRRARIVAWLQTGATIPAEVVTYDASGGHTGSSLDGPYPIDGDAPCCEMDPVYFPDQRDKLSFLQRLGSARPALVAAGWVIPDVNVCAECRERIAMELP